MSLTLLLTLLCDALVDRGHDVELVQAADLLLLQEGPARLLHVDVVPGQPLGHRPAALRRGQVEVSAQEIDRQASNLAVPPRR